MPCLGVGLPAADIRAWFEGALPLQAHDLVGPTGLKKLELQGSAWLPAVPANYLIDAPVLEVLHLSALTRGCRQTSWLKPPDYDC